jgi:hypothetical protein
MVTGVGVLNLNPVGSFLIGLLVNDIPKYPVIYADAEFLGSG